MSAASAAATASTPAPPRRTTSPESPAPCAGIDCSSLATTCAIFSAEHSKVLPRPCDRFPATTGVLGVYHESTLGVSSPPTTAARRCGTGFRRKHAGTGWLSGAILKLAMLDVDDASLRRRRQYRAGPADRRSDGAAPRDIARDDGGGDIFEGLGSDGLLGVRVQGSALQTRSGALGLERGIVLGDLRTDARMEGGDASLGASGRAPLMSGSSPRRR